jgi:VanZ family protein
MIIAVVSVFGAVDEWHQSFIPRRSMSFADWIADSSGALVGALTVRLIPFLTPRRPGSPS